MSAFYSNLRVRKYVMNNSDKLSSARLNKCDGECLKRSDELKLETIRVTSAQENAMKHALKMPSGATMVVGKMGSGSAGLSVI